MDIEMQREIQRYFNIPKRIKGLQRTMEKVREDFYSRRTFTSHSQFLDGQWVMVGFRVESRVIDMVSCIEDKERSIQILKDKQRYFNRFLDSLPEVEKKRLHFKYRSDRTYHIYDVEARAYDEIQEIEEAINHKYGFLIEHDDVSGRSVDDVAELLGV